jgi:hypothetical protein
MIKPATIGAAIALLMTSASFAQTTPPAEAPVPPAVTEPAMPMPTPPAGQQDRVEPMEPSMAPSAGEDDDGSGWVAAPFPREERSEGDRRGWRDGPHRGWQGGHHRGSRDGHGHGWRHAQHHRWGGMGGRDRSSGAVFRLSRGEGGPSIVIRCAERDSTQECADAVMPMLERVFPDRRPPVPVQ